MHLWILVLFIFFFSSRRRHTRFDCDWSSDVCSSDLRCESNCFSTPAGVRTIPHETIFEDRKSTRLNSSHSQISYAVFCLKKKKKKKKKTIKKKKKIKRKTN